MKDIEHFGAFNLFHELTDEELNRFKARFEAVSFPAGEYVFRENEFGETLYIVEKGVVSIMRNITVDVEKNIFLATQGSVFGEFSFMDAGERSASARVDEDADLLSLKREDFDAFTAENPTAGTKLYKNMLFMLVERLRRTNDAYLDAVRWGIEMTGTQNLNFQYLISEDVDICIELLSNRIYEGRVLQLEKSDAGHEIVLLDRDGKLVMIPYHAIGSITPAQ